MDLSLTDSQQTLKDSARELFEVECPTSLVRAMEQDDRGYPADLWERISGLGWSGLPFPENLGGSGGTLTDLAVLIEEFGRALVPGPVLQLRGCRRPDPPGRGYGRAAFRDTAQDRRRLAHHEPLRCWTRTPVMVRTQSPCKPTRRDGGYMLNGTKMFVEYANSADLMLVPARSENGVVLLLVPTSGDGVSLTRLDSIAHDPQFAVEFRDVFVLDGVVGDPEQCGTALKRALDKAALLHCAHSVGGAQHVVDMTVAYTKQRVQFERAIATFQSVQHDCADMVIAIDSARSGNLRGDHQDRGTASRRTRRSRWPSR